MTPVLDILAGMLAGTLMGMISSSYAAVFLTYHTPRFVEARIAAGNSTRVAMFIMLSLVFGSILAGILAAFVADALITDVTELQFIPSSTYLTVVNFALIIPAFLMLIILREKWLHGFLNLWFAFGIYGFLVPNLVIALQTRV